MTTRTDTPTQTADWNGGEPEFGSSTRYGKRGNVWARRKVRPDGTVKLRGRYFRPKDDVQTMPIPGEWVLLFTYDSEYEATNGPTCGEWTAPADPDGFIRRYYWVPA